MARAEAHRERIGEMLLSLGLISKTQLDEALQAQRSSRMPIGKQLVALGSVSEIRMTQVLSNQLSVPWVSLDRVEFSADLLAKVPSEIADTCSVLPIYVRNVKGKGATLYVAMDDPTDADSLQRVADAVRMHVKPMIAPPSEIRRVIEFRYFGAAPAFPQETTGTRAMPAQASKAMAPANDQGDKSKLAKPKKPPPPPGPKVQAPKMEGTVAIEQYEVPSQPPAAAQRTLTLLDGTQIKLPNASSHRESPEVRMVRHLVKAVRSAKADTGSDDPVKWHDIAQAVLDSLEIRGVRLTRKEIAEAWLRHRAKREQPKVQ